MWRKEVFDKLCLHNHYFKHNLRSMVNVTFTKLLLLSLYNILKNIFNNKLNSKFTTVTSNNFSFSFKIFLTNSKIYIYIYIYLQIIYVVLLFFISYFENMTDI